HSTEELIGAGFDAEQVRHIIRLVDRNEYKRRQSPPGIKITPRAFGKDRRMPITNRYNS
ncbi:MAG: NAD+ synthase, partial [Anaerohalosphaeraceae bacterium]